MENRGRSVSVREVKLAKIPKIRGGKALPKPLGQTLGQSRGAIPRDHTVRDNRGAACLPVGVNGSSPISSRKSMPPLAMSTRPGFAPTAPEPHHSLPLEERQLDCRHYGAWVHHGCILVAMPRACNRRGRKVRPQLQPVTRISWRCNPQHRLRRVRSRKYRRPPAGIGCSLSRPCW